MGKITLTRPQAHFLSLVGSDPYLSKTFYLTGGTALSAFYYNHRFSEDIDLFSPKPFDQSAVNTWMNNQKKQYKWKLSYTQVFERLTYEIVTTSYTLKVDFVYYDFKQIENGSLSFNTIPIDSKGDIAVNKLLSISQRTAVKDFVDLYFLLQKDYTYWDLMHGVEHKFGIELEPLYASSLFTKVERFDTLPRMKNKFSLDTLKKFFIAEARRLASTMVKP